MYCDYCGKNLSTNVKYCRHCGRMLRDRLADTAPLPVITESMLNLSNIKRQAANSLPWSNLSLRRKIPFTYNKAQIYKKAYGLSSFAVVIAFVYVIMSFKTIYEYQILTTLWASLLTIYSWWKSQ
ncbi:hypothetical protein SRRS_36970 [Sporomusa rhizae]|uniref:zinc ribbon domain-containing protein n=1 Tax=Sporomusa rhizae TaxID=357999 RepID=UPI00352AD030